VFGVLSIAWLGGTFWIRAREPVMTSALPTSFPGRVIAVDGHGIRILEQGAGPAVLLVAGIGGSVASWPASFLERLAVDHRVIAVDLYGMGFSARSADFTYGFALWSQQLVSVLDALGIERASVVGHSLGGTVAIFFAANYPHRVDRVVLAGSAISFPWSFPLLIVPGPGELFLAYQEIVGPTFSAGQRAQALAAYRIRGTRVALLRYVRHSLQLHGTVDKEVPFSAAERLQTQLRDSRLVPFEAASHFLMFDASDRFASEVETFLATNGTADLAP
jgi:2-hydroxymuconate-semialdehyde hydrolase